MKTIMIVTRNMLAGGAERVIAQLANYFVSKNYNCYLVTLYKDEVFYSINTNVKICQISSGSKSRLFDKLNRYMQLRKIVKQKKPDVILSMPEEIGIYVLLFLTFIKIPIYVSERNNPWVMPYKKITRILRKIVYPFAEGIVFQTQKAQSFFPNKIKDKSIVITNPIDINRIPFQCKKERKKRIVAAGRLELQKNFMLLIDAFNDFQKENEEYSLVIYGEGTLRKQLQTKIDELGLQKKIFLPGKEGKLLEIINDSAMFVLSSDYEGLPNVLIEAMCMGMPVIATDCPSGGPRELINNNINGILVPVNNKKKLVEAMIRLTDNDLAKKMGDNAYNIRKIYEKQDVFEKWENFLFKKKDTLNE